MSLALLEGYSSPEEGHEAAEPASIEDSDDYFSEDDAVPETSFPRSYTAPCVSSHPPNASSSGLPSAFDAFSEVLGPPQFLNNCLEDDSAARDFNRSSVRPKFREENQGFPAGAVVQAKAQLVAIQERVRSDVDSALNTKQNEVKALATVANPTEEQAAELLRICLQCQVPKTFSSAKGMVCPICNDRAISDNDSKKKSSVVKDKERSKRMKGQSSHATWKSETEMVLRQQFD